MELLEPVIMDITEAFRSEDITKTDFFDFVVTPDSNDTHSIQQFTKQMRTVNAFLGNSSPTDPNNSSSKETNNNNSMLSAEIHPGQLPSGSENFDTNFWSEKDTVRIETAILEDLNKYCWNTAEDNNSGASKSGQTTDGGQIYTLTVLNGIDQNATWYRQPLSSVKEEDGSISSPNSMDHLQAGLDIDSILSIIPGGQINGGYSSNYSENTMSPNTDGLIKSETYTYEDSGFADNKDELANSLIIDTPLLEAHDGFNNNNNNNNNNDWKLTNNNTSNGSPDSLLRSALQGKAFVSRYNGGKKENNTELRRVLSTPPNTKPADNPIFIKEEHDHIPSIVANVSPDGSVTVYGSTNEMKSDDNHSVDDLILSQLDQSFPEDFEKLKRIANEVAESVSQYCQIDNPDPTAFHITPDQINILSLNSPAGIQITTPPSSAAPTSTTKPATKKYKRSNSANKAQTQVQSATSTSSNNGVRKERSLHYCSICSKGFKDKYSVNVHIRTHTGEKPFACGLCGKSFRQKAHLAKHYQTHIAQKNAAAAGGGGGNVATAKAKSR